MLIWGWGRKSRSTRVSDTSALIATFRYFSLFFVFSTTWGTRYVLAAAHPDGSTGYRDVSDAEAMSVANGGPLPAPTPWQRFSLLGLLAAVLVVVLVGALLR